MEKKYFALYLIASRPDFAQTMTSEERSIMTRHVGYWTDLMNKGFVVVFGPVSDPRGVYGLGVVAVETEEQLASMIENDPATKINRYEYYPMRAIVPSGK
jgi:uncharacterized protein YciI